MCATTKSIRKILKPFLIISYVFGLRLANLSSHAKLCLSVLYMLLVWCMYYFLSRTTIMSVFFERRSIGQHVCCALEILTTLLSIVLGIYHDKKFQNCLKKIDTIDSTLFRLGIMTDYNKLHKKTVWIIFGWLAIVILTNCSTAIFTKVEINCKVEDAMFFIFLLNYCFHVNFIGDLTTASILEYIGLKFDQINANLLQNLMRNNKQKVKQTWRDPMIYPHQCNFSKALNRKCIIWIIVHLQLELRKIFHEIDIIFGAQMTFKMASYFGWMVIDLQQILYSILINNYVKFRITSITLQFFWLSHNIFKFLLINYMCERVTLKAKKTADLLNKLSYLSYDIELREIISQFSFQIVYAPLRFCGIGFFQFGFKFLHKFVMSIATVLVIIIQAHPNK
ncbi:PREDICTED: uncharacterized protein LOC105562372 [Vollenhovia emeryi]|uniref:uncharacterized protein LOC105562372 n=1 Tax=Vollenhovia emeryi TaxID=411798 RepID=UPI0005F3F11E|nr:PREDICTED: uncharacterized protein LOC105562372 [Vollenhovia emeryi]